MHSFCVTWQYVNFPDLDMEREVVAISSYDPPPLQLILNGGLHSLMRNQSSSTYLDHLHGVLQILRHQVDPGWTLVTFHDITHTKWKELPWWKRHISADRIDRWNRDLFQLFHRFGMDETWLLTVSRWTRHLLAVTTNENRERGNVDDGDGNEEKVKKDETAVDTVGDGMHMNEAFNRLVITADLERLFSKS